MSFSKDQIVIGARFSCIYIESLNNPVVIKKINNEYFYFIDNNGQESRQYIEAGMNCNGCKIEPPLPKIVGQIKISNMNQDIYNVDTFNYSESIFKVIVIASSKEFATEKFEEKYKFGGPQFPKDAYKDQNLVVVTKVNEPDYRSFFQEKDIYSICTNHTYKTINKPKTRFQLISDSSDIEVTKQDTGYVIGNDLQTFQAEAEDLIGVSIPAEIDKLKDQLFGKVKLQGQINQSKKETAGAYREQLQVIKEEIDDLVIKITSFQDQLKLAKTNGG